MATWSRNVRFGSKADICGATSHVRFTPDNDRESDFSQKVVSALPRKRTCAAQLGMSALGQKRTLRRTSPCPLTQKADRKLIIVAPDYLSRGRERLQSAIPNRLGSARRGKKFDQSFRTFNVS